MRIALTKNKWPAPGGRGRRIAARPLATTSPKRIVYPFLRMIPVLIPTPQPAAKTEEIVNSPPNPLATAANLYTCAIVEHMGEKNSLRLQRLANREPGRQSPIPEVFTTISKQHGHSIECFGMGCASPIHHPFSHSPIAAIAPNCFGLRHRKEKRSHRKEKRSPSAANKGTAASPPKAAADPAGRYEGCGASPDGAAVGPFIACP